MVKRNTKIEIDRVNKARFARRKREQKILTRLGLFTFGALIVIILIIGAVLRWM